MKLQGSLELFEKAPLSRIKTIFDVEDYLKEKDLYKIGGEHFETHPYCADLWEIEEKLQQHLSTERERGASESELDEIRKLIYAASWRSYGRRTIPELLQALTVAMGEQNVRSEIKKGYWASRRGMDALKKKFWSPEKLDLIEHALYRRLAGNNARPAMQAIEEMVVETWQALHEEMRKESVSWAAVKSTLLQNPQKPLSTPGDIPTLIDRLNYLRMIRDSVYFHVEYKDWLERYH